MQVMQGTRLVGGRYHVPTLVKTQSYVSQQSRNVKKTSGQIKDLLALFWSKKIVEIWWKERKRLISIMSLTDFAPLLVVSLKKGLLPK